MVVIHLETIDLLNQVQDVVTFILPPLFNSTGKGVPMKRVKGYKLAYTKKLPRNSYEYPDGTLVDVATIFQVWVKINKEKIKEKEIKSLKEKFEKEFKDEI